MFYCVSWHYPLNSDGPVLLYPCLLGAAAAEAAEDAQGVGLFCTKLCGLAIAYSPCKSFSVWVNVKGDGQKRAHGKRSSPSLCSALLAPFACKTYCDSVSQSNFSGCLWALVAVMQLIPSFSSSLSSGSERGRQYQQVLRRSHVVGAGQAGRGAQLPHVRQQTRAPSAAGPWGGGIVGYNLNTAAQNPVRIHTHSGLTGSWVYFLKVEPLWQ